MTDPPHDPTLTKLGIALVNDLGNDLGAARERIAALEAERDRQAGHIAVLEAVLERERLRNATTPEEP